MKTTILYIALFVSGLSVYASNPVKDTITVTGTRFTFPLVQQWIDSFTATHPEAYIRLVSPRDPAAAQADLRISAQRITPVQRDDKYYYIDVARYALLPVANSNNHFHEGKPLKVNELRTLFFDDKQPAAKDVVVYNRLEKACAPVTFAGFYGATFEELKGKSIVGDDHHLLQAVQQDAHAVSFSNPGFIYDLRTRKPVSNIAVIPLDLNDNGKLDNTEDFYQTLDVLIQRLETAPPAVIPIEGVTFAYEKRLEKDKPVITAWVQYILHQGQQQLHTYGFLKQDRQQLANNQSQVRDIRRN